MKSISNIFKAAAIFFAVGIITLFSAYAASGFDWKKITRYEETEQKTVDIESFNYDKIIIDTENALVNIKPSEDESASISYTESKNFVLQLSDENDNYSVVLKDTREWYELFFNFSFSPRFITMYLPEDFIGDIKIETSNAQINIEKIDFSELNLKTSNAAINVSGVNSHKISANTCNGKISVTDSRADEATLKTSNNGIELSGDNFSNLTADTSNGKIDASVSAKTAVFINSNGEINLNDSSFNDVNANTSNNKIAFNKLSASKLVFKTSNGAIRGSLLGTMSDYKITSNTSNASNNLPSNKTDGESELIATTSNGSIDITFLG